MPSAALVEAYHRDGFVKGSKLIDDGWLAELREEHDRLVASGEAKATSTADDQPIVGISNLWERSEPYRRLMGHHPLIATVAALLGGDEVRIWHDQIITKPAGGGAVNHWHQDLPLWPDMGGPSALTVWLALDDADEENGCMSMVPGSHRWGRCLEYFWTLPSFAAMPATFQGHAVEVRTRPVAAGEAHFHHSLTWHGSRAHRSSRSRRALAMHFFDESVRYTGARHFPCGSVIESAVGEPIRGPRNPLVWKGGRVVELPPLPQAAQPVG
jgi:ectoine hydroxylase-related dioxygenase (phytanoyl-CoA dioxygenase family)